MYQCQNCHQNLNFGIESSFSFRPHVRRRLHIVRSLPANALSCSPSLWETFPEECSGFLGGCFPSAVKSLRLRGSIDPVLEIPPQEEVWRSKVRGIRCPLNVFIEEDKAALKMLVEKTPCFPGCKGRCPILLEPLGSHLDQVVSPPGLST